MIIQLKMFKEIKKLIHVHAEKFMYIFATDLHIQGVLSQTTSSALAADGLTGITAEHIFVLDLISVCLNPSEKLVQANYGLLFSLGGITLPDKILDVLTKVAVRLEYRNIILHGITDKLILEPSHLISSPARNRAIIYCLALVRNHQVLADAYYLPQTSADRACSKRTVEAEKIFIGLAEDYSVCLETVYERLHDSIVTSLFRSYV